MAEESEVSVMERCPVCGMDVKPEEAEAQQDYQGRTYYFCSKECHEQFNQDPQRYVEQKVR